MTNQRDEREVAEYIWCVNCGNRIYRSGGKWFHLSTAGMSCGVPAQAAPSSEYAATRMREACVDLIKSLRSTPRGAAYSNAINDAIHKVESLTLDGEKET